MSSELLGMERLSQQRCPSQTWPTHPIRLSHHPLNNLKNMFYFNNFKRWSSHIWPTHPIRLALIFFPCSVFIAFFLPTNSSTLYCEIVADLVVIEIIGEEACRDGELPTEAGVEGFWGKQKEFRHLWDIVTTKVQQCDIIVTMWRDIETMWHILWQWF